MIVPDVVQLLKHGASTKKNTHLLSFIMIGHSKSPLVGQLVGLVTVCVCLD